MHTATTTTDHLIAATGIILGTAQGTVTATREAHGKKKARKAAARMEAALALITAGDALYEAAERIAKGEPVRGEKVGDGMALALRIAEAKAQEGRMRMAGTWQELPIFYMRN
ncbi:hypothetical protein QCN27_11590 [Cereibacter sp. SYSU M97828]|nr:hypothetical protein [Cereibacter flavus]